MTLIEKFNRDKLGNLGDQRTICSSMPFKRWQICESDSPEKNTTPCLICLHCFGV